MVNNNKKCAVERLQQLLNKNNQQDISQLFTAVFTASAGEKEGSLVGNLAARLAEQIDNDEIIAFGVYEETTLIAAIFFSRLKLNAPLAVYLLAPVAVATAYQGKGIGKALIQYGINQLKQRSVAIVVTYGDPAFYSKVGFQALSEQVIAAPLPLSMPWGWLGQSLREAAISIIKERPAYVKEFNNLAFW